MGFTTEGNARPGRGTRLARAAALLGALAGAALGCGPSSTTEDDGAAGDVAETTDDVVAGDADADAAPDGPDVPGDVADVVPDDGGDAPGDVDPDVPAEDVADAGDGGDADVPPRSDRIDILFVVDNSAGMINKQSLLADAMPAFLDALFAEAGALGIDAGVNVGVVSTDMGTAGIPLVGCPSTAGDRGCLMHAPSALVAGCAASYPSFLSRSVSSGSTYTIAQMADDFRCVATLGTSGCGFEQPLAAARAAVTTNVESGGCNEGLVRDGSTIALIFLSDENDCSVSPSHPEIFDPLIDLGAMGVRCFLHPDFLVPVADAVATVRGLEAAGHAVVVGAIVGVPAAVAECNGFGDALGGCLARSEMVEAIAGTGDRLVASCSSVVGTATPPRRFVQLAEALGRGAHVSSICAGDYAPALVTIAGELL